MILLHFARSVQIMELLIVPRTRSTMPDRCRQLGSAPTSLCVPRGRTGACMGA